MELKYKYSGGCFEHWLVMLSTMNTEFTKAGFEEQMEHYVNFEGKEEMKMLQNEINHILEAKDLIKFKDIGKRFNIEEVNDHSLALMAEVIMNWR